MSKTKWYSAETPKKEETAKEKTLTPTYPSVSSKYGTGGSSYGGRYGDYYNYSYGGRYGYGYYDDYYYGYDGKYGGSTGYDWKEAYKSRYSSSLGYSRSKLTDTISSGSGFYYGRSKDDRDKKKVLVEKAFKTARDLVIILDYPFKVSVQLSRNGDELGRNYQRRIFIPTRVLDESKMNDTTKISICSGLSIHEAAHLKYTEVKVFGSFKEKLETSKGIKCPINFIYNLANIIEDERVEVSLLEERPGYTELIDSAKSYNYKKFIEEAQRSSSAKPEVAGLISFLSNLYRIIRYPEGIEQDVIKKYSEEYKKIREILYPLPDSTKGSCATALKISEEIYKIFGEELNKLKILEKDITEAIRLIANAFECGYSECLYGYDGDTGNFAGKDRISEFIYNSDIEAKLLCGLAEEAENNTFFDYVSGEASKYNRIAKKVSPMVPAIKKLLKTSNKNYEFNIYGCRSGLLDTSKIAEAYQGVPHVYIRKGEVKTSSISVCLLVDESGSMWGNNKYETAKMAAILLSESLKGTGVEFFAYGHTADTVNSNSTEIRVYNEKTSKNPYGLSQIAARNENRDGTAILETAKRVRKMTDSPVLMFVISDGSPCASDYWGDRAHRDVRDKVKKVESMGFTVIQVTIDSVRDSKDMFTNVINLEDDLSEFPTKLGKLVKGLVLDNISTTVTS